MMWAKQSTAATLIVGPILDSAGAEYAGAVIADLSISKNGGTLTAMAAAATLTYIANGQYTLVMTTGNLDTLGRAQITCNKSTYQMPGVELMVLPATVFDALVTNATTAAGGLGDIQRIVGQTITAAAGVTFPTSIASPTNITAASGIVLAGVTHTGAVIPTVSTLTGHTPQTGDSYPIVSSAVHGNAALKTLIDVIDGIVDAILADTNELQTDWVNGGRLDLILDARASQTSVDDVPTNAELATALGTADDAVLAAIAAEAVKTAAIKTVTDKVDTGLVQDGGVYQFTVNMLELGPSGSGAGSNSPGAY